MAVPIVTRIGPGAYRVEHLGRIEIVYVAGPPEDRWAFWNGRVYRNQRPSSVHPDVTSRTQVEPSLTAPMPATVVKVLVAIGAPVRRGAPLLVLEAMKMELIIRAPRDGMVTAVHCREGDLVQPERVLIDLAERSN